VEVGECDVVLLLEAIHGTVVRKADEHGVDAPRSRTVYSILRPWAVRNDETN
jgi:2-dehydropantoate 2-reductase